MACSICNENKIHSRPRSKGARGYCAVQNLNESQQTKSKSKLKQAKREVKM